MAFDNEMSNDVLSFHIGQAFKAGTWVRVSVQGVKSLGGQKVPKMHFLAVFELLSDSLTAIYVELHQCPSHHSILLTQGPI